MESSKHEFVPRVEIEPVNPKYETRPYIEGSFFLFSGLIRTVYKKEMIGCDGYNEVWICARCGQSAGHSDHDLVVELTKVNTSEVV